MTSFPYSHATVAELTCSDCSGPITEYSRGRCRRCAAVEMARLNNGQAPDRTEIAASAARMGCENLLRRQLQTGMHWITDPARFAAACESVGLAT